MSFRNEEVLGVFYFEDAASGTGKSSEDRADLTGGEVVLSAPAGSVITDAEVVIEEALSGTTVLVVGDSGDEDGFVAGGDVTEGTSGAYVGDGTYISSSAKYYAADTDITTAITGALSAGKGFIAVRGYRA